MGSLHRCRGIGLSHSSALENEQNFAVLGYAPERKSPALRARLCDPIVTSEIESSSIANNGKLCILFG
jgi:hypothetical protein